MPISFTDYPYKEAPGFMYRDIMCHFAEHIDESDLDDEDMEFVKRMGLLCIVNGSMSAHDAAVLVRIYNSQF